MTQTVHPFQASNTVEIFTSDVSVLTRLDLHGDLEKNWKNWLKHGIYLRFTLEATEVASFITFIGSEALDIHPGLPFTSKEDKGRIDKVLEMCTNYCVGQNEQNLRVLNKFLVIKEQDHWWAKIIKLKKDLWWRRIDWRQVKGNWMQQSRWSDQQMYQLCRDYSG